LLSSGSIPVYVYMPDDVPPGAPILVYFHGGGMVLGSRKDAEPLCHLISAYVTLHRVRPKPVVFNRGSAWPKGSVSAGQGFRWWPVKVF